MEPLSSSLNNIEPLLSSKELPPSGSVHDKFQSRSSECKVVYVELNDYITIKCNNYDKKINMEDVIGVERKDSSSLIIHAYPINQCCCGGERQHEATILEASNIDQANRWYLRLKQKLLKVPFETKENELPFRRFLILVNPASGSGQALMKWSQVEEMFKHSGYPYDVLITKRAGEARDVITTLNPDKINGIVVVSGDGLVSEVVNGLMARPDWQQVVAKVTLGHIPGGSGNGVARSILAAAGERFNINNAAFLICKGNSRKIDLAMTNVQGYPPMFGLLSCSWGLISDIDFESEVWRCCGGFRFTFQAICLMLSKRSYRGRLSFLPSHRVFGGDHPSNPSNPDSPRGQVVDYDVKHPSAKCKTADKSTLTLTNYNHPINPGDCSLCSQASTDLLELAKLLSDPTPVSEDQLLTDEKKSLNISLNTNTNGTNRPLSKQQRFLGDLPGFESRRWHHIDPAFCTVYAMNLAWPSSDLNAAPYAHFSDGLLDLTWVEGGESLSRAALTQILLNMETGEHVGPNSKVHYYKVHALRLEPGRMLDSLHPSSNNGDPNNPNDSDRGSRGTSSSPEASSSAESRGSTCAMDGERLPPGPLELRVFRGILNVFAG